jgi:membrane protein required for colicin V production
LNVVDIVLIIIVLLGSYKGYRDGFLMELFSLLGIILGILGGFKLMGIALVYLSEHFDIDKKMLPYIAFGVVFLIIVIVVSLVGRMLKASIDKSFLGRVDQAAGAVLGLIKVIFLLSVAMWLLNAVRWELPEKWTSSSRIMPLIAEFAPTVSGWIGEWIPAFHDIFA